MIRVDATRRTLLMAAAALAVASTAYAAPAPSGPLPLTHTPARTAKPLKIGVIGSGRIGGTYGEIWGKAGHQVMFVDRDAATATAAAARTPGARTGTAREAATFADVLLVSVPYSAMPGIATEAGAALNGKVVIDTSNPQVARDGELVRPFLEKGAGLATASLLPGAKVVRAFNVLSFANAAGQSHRPGPKVGVPIGGDDPAAVAVAAQLVRDAGFDPVEVPGGLAGTKRFDLGPPLQGQAGTAADVRRLLGL